MVRWVWERVRTADRVDRVVIAVDDPEVAQACSEFGAEVCWTKAEHASGTVRVAEVAMQTEAEIVLSGQADEPFLDPTTVDELVRALLTKPDLQIATPVCRLTDAGRFRDPSVVKVVCDSQGRALYFSRAPIPWLRDHAASTRSQGRPEGALRHLGVYAYRRDTLLAFTAAEPGDLEQIERLEQLRALALGMTIGTVLVAEPSGPGIDTPDDLAVARALVAEGIR